MGKGKKQSGSEGGLTPLHQALESGARWDLGGLRPLDGLAGEGNPIEVDERIAEEMLQEGKKRPKLEGLEKLKVGTGLDAFLDDRKSPEEKEGRSLTDEDRFLSAEKRLWKGLKARREQIQSQRRSQAEGSDPTKREPG